MSLARYIRAAALSERERERRGTSNRWKRLDACALAELDKAAAEARRFRKELSK